MKITYYIIIAFTSYSALSAGSDTADRDEESAFCSLSFRISFNETTRTNANSDIITRSDIRYPSLGLGFGAGYYIRLFNTNLLAGPGLSYSFYSDSSAYCTEFAGLFNASVSLFYFLKSPGEGLYLKYVNGRFNNSYSNINPRNETSISEWGNSQAFAAGYTSRRGKCFLIEISYNLIAGNQLRMSCITISAGVLL